MPDMLIRRRKRTPTKKTQENETPMQETMGKGKEEEWTCQEQGCGKNFHTPQELKRRNTFYCHEKTTQRLILKNAHGQKLDRRKPLQEGIPNYEQTVYRNNVHFSKEEQQWKCRQCAKRYGPQSKRNAILHSRTHTQTTNNQIQKQNGKNGGRSS